MGTDRSWMHLSRRLSEYENGVIEFLDASFSKVVLGGQIRCPCKRCKNCYWLKRHEVFEHLKAFGFVENYDVWIFHGENPLSNEFITQTQDGRQSFPNDTVELLTDRFRDIFEGSINVQSGPNDEAKTFYNLVEDGKQELYPGCKNFSKLSFIIRLFLFKTLHGISNVAFDDLIQLLKEMVPEANLPSNFSQARNIVRNIGLNYKKIHACPNDCMLYWKEYENVEESHVCHVSKWRQCEGNQSNEFSKSGHQIPAKVLWHFPLKPRLQRLYMCSKTAEYMTWHADKRPKDGNLRHPADGLAWQQFDSLYPIFANEPRNVRLGLASDGFSQFCTLSVAHSTWPVVLINYNLPPWMFMKSQYLMLSLLIPGPEGPGNNIDIYLHPLIDELKDLWNIGLETYDKLRNETFMLHALLSWTISDFPGYSMLSGWKTKGGKKRRNGKLITLDPKLGEQAHRYAIFNSDSSEVDQYIKEQEAFVNSQQKKNKWNRARNHSHEFANWLKEKATKENVSDQILWLSKGPAPTARRYKGYYANGCEFYTKSRDARRKTQNSGVSLSALTSSFASSRDQNPVQGEVVYYGSILEIIELNYWSKFNLVLFCSEWYQLEKDEYGMTYVNVNRFYSVDDHFVIPSQVHQVFYVLDPCIDGLHYVMTKVPRDIFDYGEETNAASS